MKHIYLGRAQCANLRLERPVQFTFWEPASNELYDLVISFLKMIEYEDVILWVPMKMNAVAKKLYTRLPNIKKVIYLSHRHKTFKTFYIKYVSIYVIFLGEMNTYVLNEYGLVLSTTNILI